MIDKLLRKMAEMILSSHGSFVENFSDEELGFLIRRYLTNKPQDSSAKAWEISGKTTSPIIPNACVTMPTIKLLHKEGEKQE